MGDDTGQDPGSLGIGRLFWITHEAVVAADLDSELVVLWNPSAERIFGYRAEEAIGMPLDRLVPEELLGAHHQGVRRFREMAPARLVGGPPIEVPALTQGGRPLTISLSLSTLGEAGERRHVVAVIRDVTAQKALEEREHRALESMKAFVATASHDLRTPLTSVMGFARLLVDHGEALGAEKRAEFARAITRAGEQASRLVDDLLTLSKLQAGVAGPRPTSVDLAAAAREAVVTTDVAAEVAIAEDLSVTADEDHLQRILGNLLVNAATYGRPPIRVAAERCGEQVEVRVTDRGEGVPADFVASLFEPFTRADTVLPAAGTGLGLSIVKGLAEANGGAVRYEHGDGACFVVTLASITR